MGERILFSRRALSVGLAGALLTPHALASEPSLSFLVIGDWGKASPAQRIVANALGLVADDTQTRFVISTGDNFYDEGVRSISDPLWRAAFEDIYTAPALQAPWYPVLGNHDHRGDVQAQIDYAAHSPRWRMRGRYWREDMSIGAASASFFFLDTHTLVHSPRAARAQLAWLERELAASSAEWKIAIGHHPIFSCGVHGPEPALCERIKPLFERHGVSTYFCGHDHNLEHAEADGVHYVCSGAGASPRSIAPTAETRFGYGNLGFASCVLSGGALSLRFHDASGAIIYRNEIAPARSPEIAVLAARTGL